MGKSHGGHFPICTAETSVTPGRTRDVLTHKSNVEFKAQVRSVTSVTPGKTQDVLTLDMLQCEVY